MMIGVGHYRNEALFGPYWYFCGVLAEQGGFMIHPISSSYPQPLNYCSYFSFIYHYNSAYYTLISN